MFSQHTPYSTSPEQALESLVTPSPRPDQQRIVIVGDPHTGKSVMSKALFRILRHLDHDHYPHSVSATPDGEGQGEWFHKTAAHSPALAMTLKDLAKGSYSEAFIERIEAEIRGNVRDPVILIDLGGVPDEMNLRFASSANKAVILFRESEDSARWRAFCEDAGVQVIAEIRSDYHTTRDVVESGVHDEVLRGSAHHLDRAEPCEEREILQELARRILNGIDRRYDPPTPVSSSPEVERTYLVSVAPTDPTLLQTNDRPVVTLNVKFNQRFKDVPGDRVLHDALMGVRSLEDDIPSDAIVLIDGPMSMPIAVGLTKHLQTGSRTIALYARDVSEFVVVSPGDLEGAMPAGSLARRDSAGLMKAASVFKDFKIEQVHDQEFPTLGSLRISIRLSSEESALSPQVVEEGVNRMLEVMRARRYHTGGTLYLTGRMPVALAGALADASSDCFTRAAIYVPQHDGPEKYLPLSSLNDESPLWLPEPTPRTHFEEFATVPVAERDPAGVVQQGVILTMVPDPLNQTGVDRLIEEAVHRGSAEPVMQRGGRTLYMNGRLPVAVAAAVADVSPFDRVAVFVPQHPEDEKYLLSYCSCGTNVVFLPVPTPNDYRALPVEELITTVLGHEIDADAMRFTSRSLLNARAISRTISGVADRTASDQKPELLLAGHTLAKQATDNLVRAIYELYEAREIEFYGRDDLQSFMEHFYMISQRSLLHDPTPALRTWDLPYSRIPHERVEHELRSFYSDLSREIDETPDPIRTSLHFQYRFSHELHPYKDGTGRMTLLIGDFILARYGLLPSPLPDRDKFFSAMDASEEEFHRLCRSLR